MTSSVWQLDQRSAQLEFAQLTAAVDLSRPADGLAGLRLGADSLGDGRLLGIEIPSSQAAGADWLMERYVRGSDLVAVYRESESWPVRVDAVWRAVAPAASGRPLPGIELVTSVRTHLLDSRPELSVQSTLPATEVLRMVDEGTGRFETFGAEGPCVVEPGRGPGCLVFRLPGSELSYAEMVHPADLFQERLERATGSHPMVRVRHRLFPGPLEKGVILRARVFGLFLRRADDTRVAAESYAAFAAAGPPLGA